MAQIRCPKMRTVTYHYTSHHETGISGSWRYCLKVARTSTCEMQTRRLHWTLHRPTGTLKLLASLSGMERMLTAATTQAGPPCTQRRDMATLISCGFCSTSVLVSRSEMRIMRLH